MKDGKAKLLRDDFCDGLGNCLPACPVGAITFEEREAAEYDEAAVKASMAKNRAPNHPSGCPGATARTVERETASAGVGEGPRSSRLNQWPVQIKLVPVKAPYFENADLLVSADCAAYAHGNFHDEFMRGKITLIGCPKLDECDYSAKLTEILKNNNIKSVTVVRMEVPCCRGLEIAVAEALKNSGAMIVLRLVVLSVDGHIIEE
jgi:ferredoxin